MTDPTTPRHDAELKPCPFCGGKALPDTEKGLTTVGCFKDGCADAFFQGDDRASVFAAWNIRAALSPAPEAGDEGAFTAAYRAMIAASPPATAAPEGVGADWQSVAMWMGFSASVIKSGEPWTAQCQQHFDEAKAAFGRLAALPQETEGAAPHCQACGGEIQGWCCQSCDKEFRENDDGRLVFDADEPLPSPPVVSEEGK